MEICFKWGQILLDSREEMPCFWWNNEKKILSRVLWRPLPPNPHPTMDDCKFRWLRGFLVEFCSLEAAEEIVTAAPTPPKMKCCPWMDAWHDAQCPGPRRGLP